MAVPAVIAQIGKALLLDKITREAKKAITHEVVKETNEERVLRISNGLEEPLEFNAKKAGTRGGMLLSGIGLLAYVLSATGVISPEIADLVNAIISNPEVQHGADCLLQPELDICQ